MNELIATVGQKCSARNLVTAFATILPVEQKVYWHHRHGLPSPTPAIVIKYHAKRARIVVYNPYSDSIMTRNARQKSLSPRFESATIDERYQNSKALLATHEKRNKSEKL